MSGPPQNKLTPAEFQQLKESFQERLVQDPDMTPACLRVALVISWHMNKDTGEAWPGAAALTKRARVCTRTVRSAVKYIIEKGHVAVERAKGKVLLYHPQPVQQLLHQCKSSDTGATALTN